jgi:DNA repair protein RadA/Sms
VEFKQLTKERGAGGLGRGEGKPRRLSEIKTAAEGRLSTGVLEFDRVLGGGLVAGSVVLLAGEPGIGKSTLLLQLASLPLKILYISGEESIDQIKLRAERLRIKSEELLLISETNVEGIFQVIDQNNYSLIIIDSVQTLWTEELVGTAGSVGQVKESAAKLINLVKSKGVPLILVGQVTKEGSIAGPMTLAHMVDVALFLEGERYQSLRLLRGIKNRFGPTDEVGVFEMGEKGLFGVENPSEVFLGPSRAVPGSVTFCALEGTRPILVEIQALVTKSFLAIPRRVANGLDYNRLVMLTAVLQKSLNLTLWDQDLYLNIAGGFKIGEPAADLAVCLAIISSFRNKPLLQKTCAFGEVGLLGEVRRVSREEKREKEAKRLGFNKIITPKNCRNLWEANKNF